MSMTLRLTPEEDQLLNFLAQTQGISKQQAAINAIITQATRIANDAAIADIARKVLPSYAMMEKRIQQGF